MRRFLRDNKLRIIDFPDEYNEFRHLLLGRQSGTVGEMLNAERPCLDRSSLVYGDPATVNFTLSDNPKEVVVPLPPIKEARNSFFGLGVYLLKSKFRIEDKLRFP